MNRCKSFGRVTTLLLLLLSFALLTAIGGCGRKGRPKPPEATAPTPVTNLTAEAGVNAITLTWIAPTTNASGDSLDNLERFIVLRSTVAKGQRPSPEEIGVVVVNATEDAAAAGGAAKGRYSFKDPAVKVGQRYEYVVVAVNDSGVEGVADRGLRVSFAGESSVVEGFDPRVKEQRQ